MARSARLRVRLTPRGGRDGIDGIVGGVIRARVARPPADGAANEALIRLLAAILRVRRSDVQIESGAASRHKVIGIDGIDDREALERLSDHLTGKEDPCRKSR